MKVVLIVAVCKSNLGIGNENQLLWHLPADMKFFKETTMGYPVITGRKNYESIPEKFRPLPGRLNVVLTRDKSYHAEGAVVVNSIDKALKESELDGKEKAFIIGGGQIYREVLERGLVDEMYVSWVDTALEADTFFTGFQEGKWEVLWEKRHEKDDKNPYSFTIVKYTRKFRQ